MASTMLSLVCLLFALMVDDSAGSLRIDVSPTEVLPRLTESLTVNCSFSYAEITNISGIISLIVSKSYEQEQFIDLASLNAFTPNDVATLFEAPGKVSGHIDPNHESYLSVFLSFPKESYTGIYRCEMNGMDNNGHPSELFQTSPVTLEEPSIDQLVTKLSQLHQNIQLQEDQAKNQSVEIAECQSHLQLQENLEKEITNMGKKLDLLNFFISEEYNGHYYLLSKPDWQDSAVAAQTCQEYRGYLAQINDAKENQFVKDFVSQYYNDTDTTDGVLISGTDAEHEGQWTFTGTDTDLVFYDWGPQEAIPDLRKIYNCIALWKGNQWQWADIFCKVNGEKFLCELDAE